MLVATTRTGPLEGFCPPAYMEIWLSRLAREVGWSHKHLITRFKQQVGLPTKTTARLARLDAVWRGLANLQPARWGAIVADSGYADQARLIRDFHKFVGGSPTAFFARPEV